jgi:hypothetical protein
VVAGQWQGAIGELTGATRRVSGKAVGGGAHPNDGAVWRRWRSLRIALQCQCGRGKVREASIGDNGGGREGLTVKRRR